MESETKTRPQNNEWKKREVGALWKKAGKSQNYFSGRVSLENYKDEKFVNIVGFANKMKKENANAPDVILYYSAPSNTFDLDSDLTNNSQEDSQEDSKVDASDETTEETTEEATEEVPF